MSLDRLWAGWRSEYVADDTAREAGVDANDGKTVFERILGSGLPDDETFVVWRGPTCAVLLNAYPYGSGHSLVMPIRPVSQLDQLTADESAELWKAVTDTAAATRRAYAPDGLNIGLNIGQAAGAGIPDHLHVHCLPRWAGDTNFVTTVAEMRVVPEALDVTWTKLRSAWSAS